MGLDPKDPQCLPCLKYNNNGPWTLKPKKSLESSLARALALENMLVAGYRSNKQNSKTTEKKYFKILNNPKIKFSEKVNVKNHIDFSFNPCK